MRRLGTLWAFVALATICILPGCGKSAGPIIGGTKTAQFSLTIHDSAPSNITVLSLQVQVKSALLQPGAVSVSLPETVDLALLQSDTAILSSLQIPAATYTSLVVDFENPVMTFINNTGGPVTPNNNPTCAAGAVCTITPLSSGGSPFIFGSAPVFPFVVTQNTEVGLELDLDIADLVQSDYSLDFSNALNIAPLTPVQGAAEIRHVKHVLGTVSALATNAFTLITPTNIKLGITTDGSTIFKFPATCLADNFSCVKVNQVLELDVSLEGNGTILAKEADLEADVNVVEISGLIVSLDTNSPPQSFQMLVRQASPAVSPTLMPVGLVETVSIGSPTTFSVDNHSFVLPAGLSFTSAASLLVGQEVLADVNVILAPSLVIRTSSLALRRSQVTALVSTAPIVGGSSFVLSPLPSIFQTALPTNILQMKVETTNQTTFENLTPDTIAGVLFGNNVSVGGFLFNASGTATIATDTVRGQPIPN
jgi:hypothetical protein